jgi:hypothetical protein
MSLAFQGMIVLRMEIRGPEGIIVMLAERIG